MVYQFGKKNNGEFEIECSQIDDLYIEYKIKDHQYEDI